MQEKTETINLPTMCRPLFKLGIHMIIIIIIIIIVIVIIIDAFTSLLSLPLCRLSFRVKKKKSETSLLYPRNERA